MKDIVKHVLGIAIGLLCDWALIHNFFWQAPSNVYYQRYIHFYEFLSWVCFAGLIVIAIHLAAYKNSPHYRGKNAESGKKIAHDHGPRLWKTIYRYANTYPMLIFTGVFVGDISLTVVWTLSLIMGYIVESYAKDVSKIVEETEALEASMKAGSSEK